jgi:uncharacterized protein (TIGR01244 family)
MELHQPTLHPSASPQIGKVVMAAIANQGFSNFINNRPDGECEDLQPAVVARRQQQHLGGIDVYA